MQDPELCDDLFLDGGLHLQVDHLLGDHGARLLVAHAVHHATITSAFKLVLDKKDHQKCFQY